MADLKDFTQEVKARVRLSEVIGEHVELRQRGTALLGLCPFHSEKTPSFQVNDERGFYHCFGCGVGGDAIKFLQEVEGLAFIDALKKLAALAGLQMPELEQRSPESEARRQQSESERDKLLGLHRRALDFFRRSYAQNRAAQEYARGRGLTAEALERFQIGYAPEGWHALLDELRRDGTPTELIVVGGLASSKEGEGGERVYDRFRHRLIFPICDTGGKPIAFGARAMRPEDEPKYLNSPESPIYHKSEALYGVHLARMAVRQKHEAILLEGYMDVIAMWQAGFENVLASCGTALTRDQARQIQKMSARTVYFLYDGDEAGQKAMRRGCQELFAEDLTVKVIALPAEHDPDSYLRALGAEALQARVGEATDAFDYFLRASLTRHGQSNVRAIADEMLDLLAAVTNRITRAHYFALLAEMLGISERQLEHDVRQYIQRRERSEATAAAREAERDDRRRDLERDFAGEEDGEPLPPDGYEAPGRAQTDRSGAIEERELGEIEPAERALLRIALEDIGLRAEIARTVPGEWIATMSVSQHLSLVLAGDAPAEDILGDLDRAGRVGAAAFLRETLLWRSDDFVGGASLRTLEFLVRRLRKRHLERRRRDLFRTLRAGSEDPDAAAHALALSAQEYYHAAGDYYGGPREKIEQRQPRADGADG